MSDFKDLQKDKIIGYGSKADVLSSARQYGINTPKGFVFRANNYNINQIQSMCDKLDFPLIARSSTNIEDGSEKSFAGVFKSEMVFGIDDIPKAIRTVASWSESSAVKEMLGILGAKNKTIQTNIIVQEYVSGVSGGVMFIYPEKNEFVVESGHTASDVTDGKSQSQLRKFSLDGKLKGERAKILQKAAREIAKFYNKPCDVEWVITAENTVYVLQIRAVTVQLDLEDYTANELNRLNQKLTAHNLYDDSILPDIEHPTPVTISLLSKIYSSQGSFGEYIKYKNGRKENKNQKSFVVSIFGYPYLDYKSINDYFFNQRSKVYVRRKGLIVLSSSLKSILYHPIKFAAHVFSNTKSIFRLKKFLNSDELFSPSQTSSIAELVDYLVRETSFEAFIINDYIQFMEKQIRKQIKNDSDYEQITQDTSTPSWANSSLDVEVSCWHLSYNENEISSPPMTDTKKGISDAKSLYDVKIVSEKKEQSKMLVLDKLISTWDKTLVRNKLDILNRLQQRRNNTHDNYVKAIRLLHHLINSLHKSSTENLYWYADIDEILHNKLPSGKVLKKRKEIHTFLQSKKVNISSVNKNWNELLHTNNESSNNPISLSLGGFKGYATVDIDELDNRKTVLLVKSLSNTIIFSRNKLTGVITERGGKLSHVAILARELGLPIVRVNSIDAYVGRYVVAENNSDVVELGIES